MRAPYPRGSPSLVNGAAFRSQSLSVRRFESCPPHYESKGFEPRWCQPTMVRILSPAS